MVDYRSESQPRLPRVEGGARGRVNVTLLVTAGVLSALTFALLVTLAITSAARRAADVDPEFAGLVARRRLAWIDRDGRLTPLAAPPRGYVYPRLSHDASRVVVDIRDEGHGLWEWDTTVARLQPVSVGRASDISPVWSPDGGSLIFARGRGVAPGLFRRTVTAQGPAHTAGAIVRLPTESNSLLMPTSISPDGRWLLATASVASGFDIVVIDLAGDGGPQPFIESPSDDLNAEFSPDGRWVAYQSRRSGQFEVWVTPAPGTSGPPRDIQVSVGGGTRPVWTQHGRELLYLTNEGAIMSVALPSVRPLPPFQPLPPFEAPRPLFTAALYQDLVGRTFDVTADGARLLVVLDP